MSKIIRLTETDLVRLVKRVIKEQSLPTENEKWKIYAKELGPLSQKTIPTRDGRISYNWGRNAKDGYTIGLSIDNDGVFSAGTDDPEKAEYLKGLIKKYGLPLDISDYKGTTSFVEHGLYSMDPMKVIPFMKELIKNLR